MIVESGKYFSREELQCTHCGACEMDEDFMRQLDLLRDAFGPLVVTSGYRCPEHPIEVAKARPGAHATGKAVDIAVKREEAYRLLQIVFRSDVFRSDWNFTGVGINQKGSGRFIHLDTVSEGIRPTVWSY